MRDYIKNLLEEKKRLEEDYEEFYMEIEYYDDIMDGYLDGKISLEEAKDALTKLTDNEPDMYGYGPYVMSNTRSNIFGFDGEEKIYMLGLIKENTMESVAKLLGYYVNSENVTYLNYKDSLDEPDEGLLFIHKSGYSLVVDSEGGIEGLFSKETKKFVPIGNDTIDTIDVVLNENVFEWLEYVKDNK